MKGERHPHEDAMEYIREVLGDIDIETTQQGVFAFDWVSVPELSYAPDGGCYGGGT